MKKLVASFVCSLSLAFLAGCGGGSGGTCANSPACGGNIVGTWKITSACASASPSMFDMSCPGASESGNLTATGTYTFNADMSYSTSVLVSGTVTVGLPASCLSMGGVTVTCDELNALFASGAGGMAAGSAHCSSAGSNCNCTISMTNSPQNDSGTYTTTAAGLLSLMAGGGATSEQDDYCVSGGTALTISPHPGSAMMGGVSGTIAFTKQ
jgi:hypothetical protein